MILFLKAIARGYKATGNLFDAPVDVAGFVRRDGVYIAPHHSTRKKLLVPAGQGDLFGGAAMGAKPAAAPVKAKPVDERQGDMFAVKPAAAVAAPAPVVEKPVPEPAAAPQTWTYGMRNRPPAYGAIPKGHIPESHKPSTNPRWRHGTIDYPRQLTDKEIYDYELESANAVGPEGSSELELPKLHQSAVKKLKQAIEQLAYMRDAVAAGDANISDYTDDIAEAHRSIDRVRTWCQEKGQNADKAIAELGGIPEVKDAAPKPADTDDTTRRVNKEIRAENLADDTAADFDGLTHENIADGDRPRVGFLATALVAFVVKKPGLDPGVVADILARKWAKSSYASLKAIAPTLRRAVEKAMHEHAEANAPAPKRVVIKEMPKASAAPEPKYGDTKTEDGIEYVLRDGRWHRAHEEVKDTRPPGVAPKNYMEYHSYKFAVDTIKKAAKEFRPKDQAQWDFHDVAEAIRMAVSGSDRTSGIDALLIELDHGGKVSSDVLNWCQKASGDDLRGMIGYLDHIAYVERDATQQRMRTEIENWVKGQLSDSKPSTVVKDGYKTYENLDEFEADWKKLGDTAIAAMSYAAMGKKRETHDISLKQLISSINSDRRDELRMTPGKSHEAGKHTDVTLSALALESATKGDPKLLDKIKGPFAALAIDAVSAGGDWEKYPQMILPGLKKLAEVSKGYKARKDAPKPPDDTPPKPKGGLPKPVIIKERVKVEGEGTHTSVTLPDGSVHRIQRLNSVDSMGTPGWHDYDLMTSRPDQPSFLADTEEEAIKRLVEKFNTSAEPTRKLVTTFGVPAGTSKTARRKANRAATDLLKAKTDAEMTDADRAVLARYTGTGGIGDSLNEFYTEPAVASAMWSILANLGFTGGDVLEPSCATGVFQHTAPAGAHVVGVEYDPTSARIAGILHSPAGHEINSSSLERFATQDGRQFGAVIGNVPFGIRGGTIKDDKPDLSTAEQYFLNTALDKTVDGGIVALIVPTGIMDSSTGRAFRERILRKGEFLGAHRLPNTAFEAAHTGVTTDIVVFRKRPQEVAGALSTVSQDQLRRLGVWNPEFVSGDYFTGSGASNVMGRMEDGWRSKAGMGQDITVNGSMSGIPEALAKWVPAATGHAPDLTVESILASLGDDAKAKRAAVNGALKTVYQVAKPGDVKVMNGIRYVLQGEPPRWHRTDETTPEAVEDAHAIGAMLDKLAGGKGDMALTRAQTIEALDDYVRDHGVPAQSKDLARWLSNPSLALMPGQHPEDHAERVKQSQRRAARLLGAVNADGSYSDLVTGRDRAGETATLDTVAVKLSLEGGGFTVDQLAAASGKGDREAVLDHLFASPAYAVMPDGTTWTTMDSYVSGDLWAALDAAKVAGAHEGLGTEYRDKYAAQAAALETAIAPQSLEDVEVLITSGFVTPEVLTKWFDARRAEYEETSKSTWAPSRVRVTYADGWWDLNAVDGNNWDAEFVGKMLNRNGVRKDDKEKVERLNREFREWILSSPLRDQVEDAYNRTYRGYRAPVFSDTPIAIPGLNPALNVNGYHFAGLRWALEAGKGIIAADVGLGKTGRGLMLAKLAVSTGQAKKPTFVVPKSVLANWQKEAEFWFPGSRVLVIGESYTTDKDGKVKSKPDTAADRRRKYQDMQQNDYDFVFISHPAWNDLDVDPITKGQYTNDDFWVKRGDRKGNEGSKKVNKAREAYEQALAKKDFTKREDTVYFGDLGIDMLIMDEGQAFKNLWSAKNRFGESPKFLGGSGESKCATDTYFKSRQLKEKTGGKGVFMLTATPTKNSPLEVYSMLSHIAPEAFERMGIKNSEDFLDRFVEFENDTILNTSGQLEKALVTAGFKNMGELREVMKRYIDRKTAADVGLKLPDRDDQQHFVDMTPEQESVYQELREAAAAKHSKDDTADSHIFSIMSKMGKASIDLSMLGAEYAGAKSPKIDAAAANVAAGVKDGGQIVFCDAIQTHEKITDALVKSGVPRDQIAIINGVAAPNAGDRQKICDDFNAGKFKVVIGNTATMGEGLNLQKGTTDIHHLDLPWEPSSLQQRNGRGLRQGNTKAAVRIHTYLAKGSFDGYRYQTIMSKKDWQDLLWNGGDRVENLARQSGGSRQDMLIMLSANPDEAKAKYDADKTAATERKTAEDRGKAVDLFGKWQEIRQSIGKMRAAKIEGPAFDRARARAKRIKESLRDMPAFLHKHLLDSDTPTLIEPVTGHAYMVGSGFETDGSADSPVRDKGKWIVTGIDRAAGVVKAKQVDAVRYNYERSITIKDMKSGVVPYDNKAEKAAA